MRLCLAASLVFFALQAFPQQCIPSAQQVAVFEHRDATGRCVVRGVGSYPNSTQIGLANDTMTSVRVGAGVELVLCTNENYLGDCALHTADVATLVGTRIGNDRVSSMIVRPRGAGACMPGPNEVSLYLHSQYEGPCVVKPVGEYATAQAMGIANDAVSAARVGANVQLVLCADPQYGGYCELATGNIPDFFRARFGNDRLSSIKVQPRGFRECAPGAGQASFYMHGPFLAPCSVRGAGDYPDAAAIGLPNDSITAIAVGSAVQVCACVDPRFQGRCVAFTADDPDVHDNIGNDVISSVQITARGAACPPRTTSGTREVQVSNCHRERRPVYVWVRDLTADRVWREKKLLQPQFFNDQCPADPPFVVVPENGHTIQVAAVDPQNPGCGGRNEVTPGCTRAETFLLVGSSTGSVTRLQVE
ncbi:MAG TPA: hypothetical protein VEK11_14175 [Thermoanaerobaculia bacterium]|nr:hypothetical protein [Thermoanaerobaculia bacterium]